MPIDIYFASWLFNLRITGLSIDFLSAMWDIFISLLTGFVVWAITVRLERKASKKRQLNSDIQDASRHIAALRIYLSELEESGSATAMKIEIEQRGPWYSFDELPSAEQETIKQIFSLDQELLDGLESGVLKEEHERKRLLADLLQLRVAILGIRGR